MSSNQEVEYKFCPRCALLLTHREADHRPLCPGCGYIQYLNPIAVVAALLLSKDKCLPSESVEISPVESEYLLMVRRAGTYRGSWCIPCGYLEYNEEIRAAVSREMKEETDLTVAPESVFAVHSNFHRPDEQSVGTWFLTRYLSGNLQPGDDALEAAFFPIDDPPEPLAFPTDRLVIQSLQQCRA